MMEEHNSSASSSSSSSAPHSAAQAISAKISSLSPSLPARLKGKLEKDKEKAQQKEREKADRESDREREKEREKQRDKSKSRDGDRDKDGKKERKRSRSKRRSSRPLSVSPSSDTTTGRLTVTSEMRAKRSKSTSPHRRSPPSPSPPPAAVTSLSSTSPSSPSRTLSVESIIESVRSVEEVECESCAPFPSTPPHEAPRIPSVSVSASTSLSSPPSSSSSSSSSASSSKRRHGKRRVVEDNISEEKKFRAFRTLLWHYYKRVMPSNNLEQQAWTSKNDSSSSTISHSSSATTTTTTAARNRRHSDPNIFGSAGGIVVIPSTGEVPEVQKEETEVEKKNQRKEEGTYYHTASPSTPILPVLHDAPLRLLSPNRKGRDCVEHNNDGLHSNSCNDDVDMTSSSSSQHSNNSTSPSPKSISPSYSSCASNAESVNGDLSSSTISSHSHHHHNASAADRGEREKDKGESSSSSECCECGERVASASGPPLPGPLKGKKRRVCAFCSRVFCSGCLKDVVSIPSHLDRIQGDLHDYACNSCLPRVLLLRNPPTTATKTQGLENSDRGVGYFETPGSGKLGLKLRMTSVLLDYVIKYCGMYEGGEFRRERVENLDKRQNPTRASVGSITKVTMSVPSSFTLDVEEDRVVASEEQSDLVLKVYRPYGEGPFPILMWMHGGGFVIGHVDTPNVDASCRSLCSKAEAVVVSVNYRLAPEHKFPTQPEECYRALLWIADHAGVEGSVLEDGDPNLIAVGGDSAGGNLAAVVSLMSFERNGPKLTHQLLIYPCIDGTNRNTPSFIRHSKSGVLSLDVMKWFSFQYLGRDADVLLEHRYASPGKAIDMRAFPPSTIITAEFDPLADDGELFARRLRAAGVPATNTLYRNVTHGFFGREDNYREARESMWQCAAALRYYYGTLDLGDDIDELLSSTE